MEFFEVIQKRHSVRNYTPEPVSDADLQAILQAGRLAPTGVNYQPQRLYVIRNPDSLAKLSLAAKTFGAPLAILVCTNTDEVWQRRFDGKKITDIDASIVTDHMMLAATALDLGTVWVCSFRSEILREQFELPNHIEPVNLLIIGHTDQALDDAIMRKTRKPLDETVTFV